MMTWTVSTQRDGIVGRHADRDSAHRACLNDMGRRLVIQDTIGRVDAIYRDGREITAAEWTMSTATPWTAPRPLSAGELDPDEPWCPGCGFANYSVSPCEVCGYDDQNPTAAACDTITKAAQ